MEITSAGRQRVEAPDFAEKLREMVQALQATDVDETEGKSLLICMIACVLTETPPPGWLTESTAHALCASDAAAAAEFARFVDAHAEEIDAVVERCLVRLIERDDATVH
jgi:hypothetical protein